MRRITRRLRLLARKALRAARAEAIAAGRRRPVRPDTVLWEAFSGSGMLGNPEALFRRLLEDPRFRHLHHVWVLDRPREHEAVMREFAGNSRVRFVRYRSVAYFTAIATSGFLVNNATFPPEFGKRNGQIYLNTWHGTPLKTMGYDMSGGALASANVIRNFVAADFLLSQSPTMTKRMYADAYRLAGLYRGKVIETGYPRVDHQFLDANGRSAARARFADAGLPLDDRMLVLYAPTWKGSSFQKPDDETGELLERVRTLQAALDPQKYRVLLKTHQAAHRYTRSRPELESILVSNEIPANVVLSIADALVTDFSSIFFDFLATGRPVAFFVPADDEYDSTRGTYDPPDALPGPVFDQMAALGSWLTTRASNEIPSASDQAIAARYDAWRSRFVPEDDGHASQRVIDVVFGRDRSRATVLRLDEEKHPRTSVLLYLGGMRSNGITTSALNLLRAIDHDRYDVTVVYNRARGWQQRVNQRRIDDRVRQFARLGGMNGSKWDHLMRRLAVRRARPQTHRTRPRQRRLWDDEWTRCFGDTRFDVVIDFSGYAPLWAALLLHSPDALRAIWLHNDIVREKGRLVRGRERLRRTLTAVVELYGDYDRLVSVSSALNEINRASLRSPLRPDSHFVAARNLIDTDGVVERSLLPLRSVFGEPILADGTFRPDPEWLAEFTEPDRSTFWLVTVGRFSTEKNQGRLLRAFALAYATDPRLRLLLVGYGPMRDDLAQLILELELEGVAFLAGPYGNPFPVVRACDGFVLSSDYEGQPMVLLEAAALGLPIVSVAFGSVHGALDGTTMRVTAMTDEALAEGIRDLAAGRIPPAHLDTDQYNRTALAELDGALAGAATGDRETSGGSGSGSDGSKGSKGSDGSARSKGSAREVPLGD